MIAPLHRGTVLADGVWLRPARVRELWEPGCRLFLAEGLCLLCFPRPRRLRSELAPGAPVVRRGDQWLALPIDAPPPGPGLVRSRGGTVDVVPLAPFDPSIWVDVRLVVVPVVPLGPPPVPLAVEEAPKLQVSLVKPDLRGLPNLVAALPPEVLPEKSVFARVAEAYAGRKSRVMLAKDEVGAPPQALSRLTDWVEDRFVRALDWLGLGDFLAQEHERYHRELQKLFDTGRLEEALRRAIPLGGAAGSGGPSRPMVLPPRSDNLVIGSGWGGGTAISAGVPTSAYERLQASYRAAAAELERQEKYDEAAYVHVQLLGQPLAAVDMYLRHGLPQKALQIAELRRLGVALIGALRWMSGDTEGAVEEAWRSLQLDEIARELGTRCNKAASDALFDAAVERWLADGDLAAAVKLRPEDPRVSEWLDVLGAGDGPAALHTFLLRHGRPNPPDPRPRFERIVEATGPDAALMRQTALELLPRIQHVARGRLANALVRAALADGTDVRARLVQVDDALLAYEAGLLPAAARPPVPGRLSLSPEGRPVFDAFRLEDGRVLVARGVCVTLHGPDGGERRRWPVPCEALIVADHQRAFMVRSGLEMTRVNLGSGDPVALGEVPADVWAASWSDGRWLIGVGRELSAVDVSGRAAALLWSRPDALGAVRAPADARIVAIEVHQRQVVVLAGVRGEPGGWRVEWSLVGPKESRTTQAVPVEASRLADSVQLEGGMILEIPGPLSARHGPTHSLVWGPRGPIVWVQRVTRVHAVMR